MVFRCLGFLSEEEHSGEGWFLGLFNRAFFLGVGFSFCWAMKKNFFCVFFVFVFACVFFGVFLCAFCLICFMRFVSCFLVVF